MGRLDVPVVRGPRQMFRYGDAQSSFLDHKQGAWLFICLSDLEISLNGRLVSFLQIDKF